MADTASGEDALIGVKVGNYTIKTKLGEGGMGAVYLAEHPLIGKKVAMKILHAEFSSNEDVVTRFFNEAKAVNDIQHPNIVDVVDYGVLDQQGKKLVYFIMEFLNGHELSAVISRDAPMDPTRALEIAHQAAKALVASHDSGIIHRDLKPDNIVLVSKNGNTDFVKLLDFGIAKLTGSQPGSRKTRTGIVMGTPAYMSPEQCEGKGEIDARTDVYALGIVIYEMLTGRTPFVGEGYGEILVQHLTQPAQPVAYFVPEIPPYVDAIVLKALAKNKDDRYHSVKDFSEALQDPVGFVQANGGLENFLATSLDDESIVRTLKVNKFERARSIAPLTAEDRFLNQGTDKNAVSKSKKTPIILIGAACLLGAFAFFVLGGDDKNEIETPTAIIEEVDKSPEVPEVIPVAEEIKIRVASIPPGATVFVDDKELGVTPHEMTFEKSDLNKSIRLVMEGYEERSRQVSLNENSSIELSLKALKVIQSPKKNKRKVSKQTRKPKNKPPTSRDNLSKPALNSTKPTKKSNKTGDNTLRPDI